MKIKYFISKIIPFIHEINGRKDIVKQLFEFLKCSNEKFDIKKAIKLDRRWDGLYIWLFISAVNNDAPPRGRLNLE